jgi:hypothetical protein
VIGNLETVIGNLETWAETATETGGVDEGLQGLADICTKSLFCRVKNIEMNARALAAEAAL